MKKLLSVFAIALLAFAVMPMVFAEGAGDVGDIGIIIDEPSNECPVIYQDHTQRSWYPNDQTYYTAKEYGTSDVNCYGDAYYDVEDRGNYVFDGETVTYYVIVEDENGDDDIESVVIEGFGGCLPMDVPENTAIDACSAESTWADYAIVKFGVESWDALTMNLYQCKLIVDNRKVEQLVKVRADDGGEAECGPTYEEKETLTFNPTLSVSLEGSINFGSVKAGSTATSNSIKINNNGYDGVVMDMYIASDDYFTSSDEFAICGDGNGIKYDQFSYYATKGSLDSGENGLGTPTNFWGLGDDSGLCGAGPDEFTPMPSHSGEITDMCRIINHLEGGSFLTQGDFMSLTLRLAVPGNCEPAEYINGKFHVVGRVV